MPLPRFERLGAERKALLLRVAAQEFAERGYENASLNDILAAADLGKSSYYYYFADKEDLFATVIEGYLAAVEAETGLPDLHKLTARTYWPTLEGWARRSVEVLARYPELVPLARQVWLSWKTPSQRFQQLVTKAFSETRAVLAAGRKLGCVRSDIDLDWLVAIVRAADQAVDEHLYDAEGGTKNMREHIRVAFDTCRRLAEVKR